MKKKLTFMNCQFAIYFIQELSRPEQLWQALNSSMNSKFDQTPLILPVPDEKTFLEVPVVQAVSKNNAFRLNISRKRLDFFIYVQGKNAEFSQIKDILETSMKILLKETRKMVIVQWIGFVQNYFIEDVDPASRIATVLDNKLKKIHGGKTLEASVDYVERISALGIKINNHTVLQPASAKFKGETKDIGGLIIARDFNTKPEENKNNFINEEFLIKFMQFAQANLNLDKLTSILWKA